MASHANYQQPTTKEVVHSMCGHRFLRPKIPTKRHSTLSLSGCTISRCIDEWCLLLMMRCVCCGILKWQQHHLLSSFCAFLLPQLLPLSLCHAEWWLRIQHSLLWSQHPHHWRLLQCLDIWWFITLRCFRWSWGEFCFSVCGSAPARHHYDTVDWSCQIVWQLCDFNNSHFISIWFPFFCQGEWEKLFKQCGCYCRVFAPKLLSMWWRDINNSNDATYPRLKWCFLSSHGQLKGSTFCQCGELRVAAHSCERSDVHRTLWVSLSVTHRTCIYSPWCTSSLYDR